MKNKNLVRYCGSKLRELPVIHKFLPKDISILIEPFVGAGAVFMNTDAEKYIINDKNKKIIDIYNLMLDKRLHQIKELENIWNGSPIELLAKYFPDTNLFIKSINKYKDKSYHEKIYHVVRDALNLNYSPVLYYFLLRTCFGANIRCNKNGQINTSWNKRETLSRVKQFNEISNYLHNYKDKLTVMNEDFETCFEYATKIADNRSIMFLDPPYVDTRANYDGYYFTEQDNIRLADCCKKYPYKWIMIVKSTPLMLELYKDYTHYEYDFKYFIQNKNCTAKKDTKHLIILNY